ncbi:hypothetical protein I302_103992 [Kwoniella bestiolae CBS 10118]|uniref:Uncharacterized protein n=1 Tax=Kwoniella bestiolae CBS 10118 TaxID=1296100 RepID=A0A1B9GA09_9TREE|nr:hypothetical protein I302_02697 [Kwoniella bestiolae CBS 10118]OCF27847.1 hypothetical protein I302_02697 [Kwoniella bestiolae CBS 10118]
MLFSHSTLSILIILATSLPALAMKRGPASDTVIHFTEGTGQADKSGSQEYLKGPFEYPASCNQEGIDLGEKPAEFDFVVFEDGSEDVKLKLACKVQCKKVSEDHKAEYTFIPDEPFLDPAKSKNKDIGKVWCDKVIERDESVWKKEGDVPLPKSKLERHDRGLALTL